MKSETNSTITHTTFPLSHRIRNQLQELFSCFFLKGKIRPLPFNAPSEVQVLVSLPEKTDLFSQRKQVTFLFKFGENYPEDPPVIFLTSDLLSESYSYRNIMNEEKWQPTFTITHIIKKFVENVYEFGLQNTLNKIFNFNQKIQSSYRHNREQNNMPILGKDNFPSFVSPSSCFKPLTDSIESGQSLDNKDLVTSQKKKRKQSSDLKFYDITEKKESQNSKVIGEKVKKKEAKPMNKNANLPKFLIRIFIKYVDRFKDQYIKKQYDKLQIQCRKMKDWKRHDKKQHAFGLKHLKRFFQDEEDGYPSPLLNRNIITQIISKYLLEQICENSQIPESHRVGYLVACRVYSLRCRNAILAGRIQSK